MSDPSAATLSLSSPKLRFAIHGETGRWTGLHGGKTDLNWLSSEPGSTVGLPFVAASGTEAGNSIALPYTRASGNELVGVSERGEIATRLVLNGDQLDCELTLPDERGPRAGWRLDLAHLDLPIGAPPEQLMPVVIETAEDLSWSYILWERSEDDLLLVGVTSRFSAWRIHYSYAGHRMLGLSLLARADDVVCERPEFTYGRLPTTTKLAVHRWHDPRQRDRLRSYRRCV